MWTLDLIALAAQAVATGAPVVPPSQSAQLPEIIVKQKQVCTTVRITGSRIGRERRCRTRDEADLEAQLARQAIRERTGAERALEAMACGPPSIKTCN